MTATIIPIQLDTGTAYGLKPMRHDPSLTEVGPGTPMGELMRRYWHPVGLAQDAGSEPRRVQVLGEQLILFRDGQGRAGLVHPRCAHRGASLYYGRVEEEGIRCCYHGWLFDVQGHCRDQPCEPEGGKLRHNVRQPWYPVQERYGLVFAYLGPPDRKPLLPRYDVLEHCAPGESIEADDSSIGGGGPPVIPCNWLQHYENVVDSFHVPILHGTFSGTQFVPAMAQMPQVEWRSTGRGVRVESWRTMENGRRLRRVTEAVLPTLRVVPSPRLGKRGPVESIGWVLPMDDTHFRIYVAGRVEQPGELSRMRSTFNGKYWWDMTEEEHRRYPGDYEAQVSQGAIASHSAEHLRTSDRGIALLRKLLREQLAVVAAGGDPVGVVRDTEASGLVSLDAGNFDAE
ncbi:MAG: aromatic ring-hydroxylating dioxygenase subunit alpha [Rubrivivax sp.]|jgi:phenylpropionate dioxygenase-like ring-hydroxylating dioxygenase large terminal subunit|nr:aromatic ring-hydroxylating dioxygenase subunit alpha [Rubrivivax sp.]